MASKISLLDLTEGIRLIEWHIVWYPREPHFFWAKWLKQGFRHVELWRPQPYGPNPDQVLWLRLTPTFEILEAYIDCDPRAPWVRFPEATVKSVSVLSQAYKMRQWFHFGPWSCTESVKAALGINKFWIRTPWQLYKYIDRIGSVLK